MRLYGDLDTLSFLRVNRIRWIGHVNRMDNKRMVYQVLIINLKEVGREVQMVDCVYGDITK
jgi:hypothetical protein